MLGTGLVAMTEYHWAELKVGMLVTQKVVVLALNMVVMMVEWMGLWWVDKKVALKGYQMAVQMGILTAVV